MVTHDDRKDDDNRDISETKMFECMLAFWEYDGDDKTTERKQSKKKKRRPPCRKKKCAREGEINSAIGISSLGVGRLCNIIPS